MVHNRENHDVGLMTAPLIVIWLSSTALVYYCFEGHSVWCEFPTVGIKLQTFHFNAWTPITFRSCCRVQRWKGFSWHIQWKLALSFTARLFSKKPRGLILMSLACSFFCPLHFVYPHHQQGHSYRMKRGQWTVCMLTDTPPWRLLGGSHFQKPCFEWRHLIKVKSAREFHFTFLNKYAGGRIAEGRTDRWMERRKCMPQGREGERQRERAVAEI